MLLSIMILTSNDYFNNQDETIIVPYFVSQWCFHFALLEILSTPPFQLIFICFSIELDLEFKEIQCLNKKLIIWSSIKWTVNNRDDDFCHTEYITKTKWEYHMQNNKENITYWNMWDHMDDESRRKTCLRIM